MMRMFKYILKVITLVCIMCACTPQTDKNMLVLDYKDFGPQVMAYELIGNEWWQWDAHGAPDPTTSYNVKVVVYRNIDLATVKDKHPVNADQQKDYRYLEYSKAITYLDKHIRHTMETPLTGMSKTLEETKQRINKHLH